MEIYNYPDGTPSIKNYITWLIVPGLLGAFTCGIGYLVLTIMWAADSNNMARANFFRALLIISAVGIAISFVLAIIMFGSLGAVLSIYN